ncbi:MAG: hypothetical protein EBX38_02230, partial [Actinobacteria bacterium]|nr:hypothetical protein [Actinomycetota bacterium]
MAESYALCKDFNKRHGTTYYWSTKVLPPDKRPHVHALYGFCRYADDIVDDAQGFAEKGSAGVKSIGVDGKIPSLKIRVGALQQYTETQIARVTNQASDMHHTWSNQTLLAELHQSAGELNFAVSALGTISGETLGAADE